MIEGSNGLDQGTATPTAPVSSAPAPASPTGQSAEERSFRQSEVNEIVKKAKYGAVEDYKRQSTERPDYIQQKYGESAPPQQTPHHAVTPESDIRRMAAEEAQRLRDTWVQEAQNKSQADQAQKTVQNFWNKISPGKEKYTDFEAVTGDIEYARFPNVVQLLADYVDNSHDVLYQLGNDRIKMANLEQLANMSPRDAIVQMQRLSQSIKDNEASGKIRYPNEPLSQLRPSNAGTDNGVLSMKDLKAKYRG